MKRGIVVLLLLAWMPSAWADRVDRNYTTLVKTATATVNQTDATLWTPASGKSIALQGCLFSASVAGTIELEVSDADVIPPVHMASGGLASVSAGGAAIYQSTPDAVLTWSSTIGASHSIMCWGYEF